jgi:molecular chaperone DnaK (HSP70)
MALQRLKEAAEKAKIELSSSAETTINLPYITATGEGPLHLERTLTRAEFQRMTSDLLDRCKGPFQQVIKDAGVKLSEIQHVVLVGGSTRMPAVVDLVKELTGLPPAPRGVPQIEVAFDIDANGIVHVHAKDLATSKEQSMTVTGGSALGKDDIDRMVKEAEAHAEEDRKRREAVELRNEADNLVFRTEKLLSENADKITDDVRNPVEEALAELKSALEGEDNDRVKRGVEKLNTTSAALGQAMYAAAQAAQQAPSAAGQPSEHADSNGASSTSEDEVVDAEIIDEDPKASDAR